MIGRAHTAFNASACACPGWNAVAGIKEVGNHRYGGLNVAQMEPITDIPHTASVGLSAWGTK